MFDSPHRFAADQPRFRAPLAPAVLDDPAFSDDPREHPHFPLADVTAIRQSPALSSHARALPPSPAPPTSVPPNPPRHSPPRASTRVRVQKRVPSHNSSTPRRASMKALVRRLTSHHNLDRIDELDETDPFGSSYHHDGPYEATATNHVQPAAPRMHADAAPRRANTVHHSRREVCPVSAHIGPSPSYTLPSSTPAPRIPHDTRQVRSFIMHPTLLTSPAYSPHHGRLLSTVKTDYPCTSNPARSCSTIPSMPLTFLV